VHWQRRKLSRDDFSFLGSKTFKGPVSELSYMYVVDLSTAAVYSTVSGYSAVYRKWLEGTSDRNCVSMASCISEILWRSTDKNNAD
jgi:hypothetical protein